jgi:Mg2+/citrate symporter
MAPNDFNKDYNIHSLIGFAFFFVMVTGAFLESKIIFLIGVIGLIVNYPYLSKAATQRRNHIREAFRTVVLLFSRRKPPKNK